VDSSRFDEITKTLARGSTRRRMVRGLGAAALGAIGVARLGGGVEAAPGKTCNSPNTRCGRGKTATCTDLQTDPNNCGTCGHVCGTGYSCWAGTCAVDTCPVGVDLCTETVFCKGSAGRTARCATDVDGRPVCIDGGSCFFCTSDADCGTGWVCLDAPCCASDELPNLHTSCVQLPV
jgi:hypothetical protein